MLSAILWDNDGVLVDTERLYFEANRDYLSGLGVELTAADFAQWFLRESRGAWHLLPDASEEQIARLRPFPQQHCKRAIACVLLLENAR